MPKTPVRFLASAFAVLLAVMSVPNAASADKLPTVAGDGIELSALRAIMERDDDVPATLDVILRPPLDGTDLGHGRYDCTFSTESNVVEKYGLGTALSRFEMRRFERFEMQLCLRRIEELLPRDARFSEFSGNMETRVINLGLDCQLLGQHRFPQLALSYLVLGPTALIDNTGFVCDPYAGDRANRAMIAWVVEKDVAGFLWYLDQFKTRADVMRYLEFRKAVLAKRVQLLDQATPDVHSEDK